MPSSIGLYIGTESVEIVQLHGTFEHPVLARFHSIPIPSAKDWQDALRSEETGSTQTKVVPTAQIVQAIAQAIRPTLAQYGSPPLKAHVGMAPELALVRHFHMPTIPERERTVAIGFEAKKHLPIPLEQLVTDYQITIRRSDPAKMRVTFCGVRRPVFSVYESILNLASVSPVSVEPVTIGAIRLLRQSGKIAPKEVCLILLMEGDMATISVAGSDVLYLSRTLSLNATQAGSAEPSADPNETLVNETRISLDYHRRRYLGEPAVGKAIVFGESLSPDWIEALSKSIELPVEMARPLETVSTTQKEVPVGVGPAVGLALKGLEKKPAGLAIDLLPKQQKPRVYSWQKPVWIEGLVALVLLGVWFGATQVDLQRFQNKIELVESSIRFPEGINPTASVEELSQKRKDLSKQMAWLRTSTALEPPISQLLHLIAKYLPTEAWLDQASWISTWDHQDQGKGLLKRHRMELNGGIYLNDRNRELSEVNRLVAKLQEDPLFKAAYPDLSLGSVQRKRLYMLDVTQFLLKGVSHTETRETKTAYRQEGGY
jgi:hypothetical protein